MAEINRGLVMEKVRQLFPSEDFEEALAILDDYGSEDYHLWKEEVQLAVLKMSNGKLERLRGSMKTARGDYRDVIVTAREPNQFRLQMTSKTNPTDEEYEIAERQDEEQWESWMNGNHFKICEKCIGTGAVMDLEENAAPTWDVAWITCPFCNGTGNEPPAQKDYSESE